MSSKPLPSQCIPPTYAKQRNQQIIHTYMHAYIYVYYIINIYMCIRQMSIIYEWVLKTLSKEPVPLDIIAWDRSWMSAIGQLPSNHVVKELMALRKCAGSGWPFPRHTHKRSCLFSAMSYVSGFYPRCAMYVKLSFMDLNAHGCTARATPAPLW